MKKIILLFALLFPISLWAQNIQDIKQKTDVYLYGEGTAATVEKADAMALQLLISQISTTVQSEFKMNTSFGNKKDLKQEVDMVLKTYSNATLHNTERVIIANEPEAVVLRYIKREDVKKVFAERKAKILDFLATAQKAESELRISDALKYNYWALSLLTSHPDYNSISFTPQGGNSVLASVYIPEQINRLFAGVSCTFKNVQVESDMKTYVLDIRYKNAVVSNFDYSFWDGRNWSSIVSAKDGTGFVELFGASAENVQEIKLKGEYIFQGEANYDKEIADVLDKIDAVPFKSAYFSIRFNAQTNNAVANNSNANTTNTNNQNQKEISKENPKETKQELFAKPVTNPETYKAKIAKVAESLKTKNYASAKALFTDEGYKMYESLLHFGNAKVLENSEPYVYSFNNKTVYRSLKMSFSFSNNKKFVEDVVFTFNSDGLIECLSFALSKKALDDMNAKTSWGETERLIITDFLENYKTAFALKRADYINSIFSDNALIIVGQFVQNAVNVENPYANNKILKYNRMDKDTYIKALRRSFAGNEYINLEFEDSQLKKAGTGDNVFGIQIKQNYFSPNYGDQGYLFLMVDLKDVKNPVIHVRTWQPEKNKDGSVYGMEDF